MWFGSSIYAAVYMVLIFPIQPRNLTEIHQKGCTCKSSTYQQISDRLCKVLAYIQYKTNLEKNWPGKQGSLCPSLTPETPDIDCPQPRGPFLRAKIIKSYVYLSVILWYPNLQVSSVQFSIFFIGLFIKYSIPQTFTVYQTLAISLLAVFFGQVFEIFGHNSTFCQVGRQFYIGQDSLI